MQTNTQPQSDESARRIFFRIGLVGVGITCLFAALGLFGWITGWHILTSLRADLIPLAPSSSVAFLLLSSILLIQMTDHLQGKRVWAAAVLTLLVLIFGLLEVVQQFTGLSLNLEDVLLPNLGFFNPGIPAGRMSPGTGALFAVAGLALLALLSQPARANPRHPLRDVAGVLACLVSVTGLTFLIAYLFGEPLLYNMSNLIPISAPAAIGFISLGLALAAAVGPDAFPGDWFSGDSTRARMLRALAPLIVLVGLFNFIADPLAHYLSMGSLPLATAIMAVAYMLVSAVVFGLATRGVGRNMDQAVAERKLATDELRALFAAMTDVVLVYDADGRYLQVAPTNPARLIRPASELLGKNVDEVLPADQARMVHETTQRALAERQTVHTTYALQIDGSEVWFEGSISPLTEHTVFFVARDITASRRAQVALRESEARFRSITEQLNDLVALTDTRGVIVYASPASINVFGLTQDEMSGRHFNEFLDASSIPLAGAAFERDMRDGSGSFGLELLMKRKDGSTFIGELNGSRILTGNQPGALVTVRDISERKRSEEVLNRMAAIVESSDDAIISKDLSGIILNWNASAEHLYGYTAGEVIGKPIAILLPPDRPDDITPILAKVRAGERLSHFETVRRARDGRLVDVSLSISPIKDKAGQIVAASTIARDITARKRAEQEILQLNRDLERRVDERTARLQLANLELARAARMKDEFLASMSHELRTPLTGILGLSESMQMDTYGHLDEKQSRIMKLIEESGRHLLDLINDILDLSKIEAGKFDLQLDTVALAGICQASLQMTRSMAQKKRQRTSFTIDPPEIVMRLDVRRLKQILVNLLSNAVKFTPEGGSLGVEVRGSQAEKMVSITVWDTGIGIAPEDLPRLFQVFVQLDSKLSRQYAGTGLGLALVKRLTELQGGRVEVQSTPGQGSRFTIRLPWQLAPAAPAAQPDAISATSMTFDEDDARAELLTGYLKNLGYDNRHQPVALGAVELAAEFKPDFVLVNLDLPDKNGLQLLKELKQDTRTRRIPVLLMSPEDKRAEVLAQGADGFLRVPFTLADVRAEVGRDASRAAGRPTPVPCVLMADDDPVVLEALTDYLSSHGLNVSTVQNGSELLAVLEKLRPDILLVDMQMPGISGLDILQRIRAHSDARIARLPMIAVTAMAMSGDRERILAAGANEYISKPVRLNLLLNTIRGLL